MTPITTICGFQKRGHSQVEKSFVKAKKKTQKIEIWICREQFFEPGETIVKTTSIKKSSYKVKCLKAKKTYYFKVRTIKKVGRIKCVSKWSKVNRLRTKPSFDF